MLGSNHQSQSGQSQHRTDTVCVDSSAVEASDTPGSRRMVPAVLFGGHTHSSTSGAVVHIWQRNDKFIARGRWQGKAYGKTLGSLK